MSGKIQTLALAKGLSFGRNGRYAVLEVLGRGWEGEVYAVADTEIEGAPNVKAAKFTFVVSDDFSVAPSWSSIDIQKKGNDLFNPDIPQDLLWYEFSDDKKKWIKDVEDVRKKATLTQEATKAGVVHLFPQIEDYGIVVLPFEGNILPFLYQIMPLVPGSTLPVSIANTTNHVKIAQKWLNVAVHAVCDYYKKGFLLGSDVHIENIMYDGEVFSIIDVSIGEVVDKEDSVKKLRETIEAVIVLGYHIANWDLVGLSVSAHVQGKVDLPWLDDPSALDKLPRRIPSVTKTKIQQLVTSVKQDAWPQKLWT